MRASHLIPVIASFFYSYHAFAAMDLQTVNAGDTVTGPVSIGIHSISLPDGSWQVVSTTDEAVTWGATSLHSPIPVRTAVLAQYDHGKIRAMLRLNAPIADLTSNRPGWRDDPCNVTALASRHLYFHDTLDGTAKSPQCLTVEPIHGFIRSNASWAKQVVKTVLSSGNAVPKDLIYTRLDYYQALWYVNVALWINPDMDGKTSNRNWDVTLVQENEKPTIELAKSWGVALQKNLNNSDGGRNITLPQLPAI